MLTCTSFLQGRAGFWVQECKWVSEGLKIPCHSQQIGGPFSVLSLPLWNIPKPPEMAHRPFTFSYFKKSLSTSTGKWKYNYDPTSLFLDLVVKSLGFSFIQTCHLLAVWPCTGHLTLLSLEFLIHKRGWWQLSPPHRFVVNSCVAFSSKPDPQYCSIIIWSTAQILESDWLNYDSRPMTGWPWVRYLTFLCLSFLVHKIGFL